MVISKGRSLNERKDQSERLMVEGWANKEMKRWARKAQLARWATADE